MKGLIFKSISIIALVVGFAGLGRLIGGLGTVFGVLIGTGFSVFLLAIQLEIAEMIKKLGKPG